MLSKRFAIVITTLILLAATACSSTPPSPTATFTPEPSATPTTVPSATPTLTPSDTPTPTVVPSNTPKPTSTATAVPQPGDVLFSDTFEDNKHFWTLAFGSQTVFQIEDKTLTGEIKAKNIIYWALRNAQYPDVDMTFDAARVTGTGGQTTYGAICRYKDDNNFYLFSISNNLYSILHQDAGTWKTLVKWTASSAIHSGKANNSLRVICSGTTLQFWANGVKLATATDKSLTTGKIGFTVGTYDSSDSKAMFDNLILKVPEPITLASGGGNGTGGTPKPTSASGGPVATPAPTEAALHDGQGSIQIQNSIDFSVHFVLWGPSAQAFDAPSHQTITLNVPTGEYGWQVFANNCELYPTGNLVVKPKAVILVETYTENSCGYAVRWGTP